MGITSPEYWEEQQRLTEAKIETILGVIGIALGFIAMIYSVATDVGVASFGLFILIGGIIAVWDGNVKLERIKHIMWTKQALREYDEKRNGSKETKRNSMNIFSPHQYSRASELSEKEEIILSHIKKNSYKIKISESARELGMSIEEFENMLRSLKNKGYFKTDE